IVSPITGEEVAAPATGLMIRQDEINISRFRRWWRLVNIEQFTTFWVICVFSILTFSMVAYSTVFGKGLAEAADLTFIQAEGQALANIVGGWFGALFWIFGTLSLILVALGILDYVSRLVADVLKTLYFRENDRWSESRMYFIMVWTLIAIGTIILLAGFDAPLILLVTSACISGGVMAVYSVLLIQLNRTALPEAIRVKGWRLGVLVLAALFYIFFVGWFIITQIQGLLGG
ncbi:MAG TPA: Nramp family divalent metal transporter, partial [Rubrobacteraceae bacterium]